MAARKGNKFALGNKGRSKEWTTPKELEKEINNYFDNCDNNKRSYYDKKTGETIEIPFPLPYTTEGLCRTLDCSRATLNNYEKEKGYEEFFYTVEKAKRIINQNKMERALAGLSNSSIAIFDFKNNADYTDNQQIETKDTTPKTREKITKQITVIKRVIE